MQKGGFVYIMCSPRRSSLYIGVTSDLRRRVWQHKTKHDPGSYTAKYGCVVCVYYDYHERIEAAIATEKKLKASNRRHKEQLITSMNPNWIDLWPEIDGV